MSVARIVCVETDPGGSRAKDRTFEASGDIFGQGVCARLDRRIAWRS